MGRAERVKGLVNDQAVEDLVDVTGFRRQAGLAGDTSPGDRGQVIADAALAAVETPSFLPQLHETVLHQFPGLFVVAEQLHPQPVQPSSVAPVELGHRGPGVPRGHLGDEPCFLGGDLAFGVG